MANTPVAISGLDAVTTVAASDLVPVVASGTTNKMTVANLLASLAALGYPVLRVSKTGAAVGYSTLQTAVAAAVYGDRIQLAPGVYDLATTPLVCPAGITMSGAGSAPELSWGDTTNMPGSVIVYRGKTAGTGGVGMGVVPGSNNVFENLSVVTNATTGLASGAFGCYYSGTVTQAGSTEVLVRNCYFFGNNDAVWANQGTGHHTVRWEFQNCILEGGYDTANVSSTTCSLRFVNCIANVDATKSASVTSANNSARCFVVSVGTMDVFGGQARILRGYRDGTDYSSHTLENLTASAGTLTAIGVGLTVDALANDAQHMAQGSAGVLLHRGCYVLGTVSMLTSGTPIAIAPSECPSPIADGTITLAGITKIVTKAGMITATE